MKEAAPPIGKMVGHTVLQDLLLGQDYRSWPWQDPQARNLLWWASDSVPRSAGVHVGHD